MANIAALAHTSRVGLVFPDEYMDVLVKYCTKYVSDLERYVTDSPNFRMLYPRAERMSKDLSIILKTHKNVDVSMLVFRIQQVNEFETI